MMMEVLIVRKAWKDAIIIMMIKRDLQAANIGLRSFIRTAARISYQRSARKQISAN